MTYVVGIKLSQSPSTVIVVSRFISRCANKYSYMTSFAILW